MRVSERLTLQLKRSFVPPRRVPCVPCAFLLLGLPLRRSGKVQLDERKMALA